jgi:uridine phosphorylase
MGGGAVFGRLEQIRAARFSRVAERLATDCEASKVSRLVPAHLRPTAPLAADAILVGDPGRALLLAQELLEQPKMSNHARGLWGYSGRAASGAELTIQSTGIGAPSAAAVLADLAELGVRRAVRVGTCVAAGKEARLGELLLVAEAVAAEGSAATFGLAPGTAVEPDAVLLEQLRVHLGTEGREAWVVSLDAIPADAASVPADVLAADMQTVAILAKGRALGIAAAAVLIVAETPSGETLPGDQLETAAKLVGRAVSFVFSNPKVEG